MIKKTDQVKQAIADGNIKKALQIAKGFRLGLTKEERDILSRGYECLVHSEWYKQLHIDVSAEVEKAIKILQRWA